MTRTRIFFIIILVLTLIMGILALPTFSVNIAGHQIDWPQIDLNTIGITSDLGNLQRGSGIFGSSQIVSEASFTPDQKNKTELLEADSKVIRDRLDAAGLYDVKLKQEKSGDTYRLVFDFPAYYNAADLPVMVDLLTTPGNITIVENDTTKGTSDPLLAAYFGDYAAVESSIKGTDITALTPESRASIDSSLLRVDFNASVTNTLAVAITKANYTDTNATRPLIMKIDDKYEFLLVDISEPTQMLARSFNIFTYQEYKIISTYTLDRIGVKTTYNASGINQVPPVYAEEGRPFLAATFVLSAAALGLVVLIKRGRKGALAFGLSLAFSILLAIFVLKLAAAVVSIGFVIGFVIMFVLLGVILVKLIDVDNEMGLKVELHRYQQLAAVMFVITGILYIFHYAVDTVQDILGIVAIMSAVLYISSSLVYKIIFKAISPERYDN